MRLTEALQGGIKHPVKEHPFIEYVEDMVDGVRWRWKWSGKTIVDLWGFCPVCDAQLVYSETIMGTRLICERCPSDGTVAPRGERGRVVTTVLGGDWQYALAATQREIRRRIRVEERLLG